MYIVLKSWNVYEDSADLTYSMSIWESYWADAPEICKLVASFNQEYKLKEFKVVG
jgi:hypothetical protein